jgi:hypothetical protein
MGMFRQLGPKTNRQFRPPAFAAHGRTAWPMGTGRISPFYTFFTRSSCVFLTAARLRRGMAYRNNPGVQIATVLPSREREGMFPTRDFPSCADIESKPRVALGEVARETRCPRRVDLCSHCPAV